jgi:hypothetical protein
MKRPLIASPPWTTEDEQRLRVLLIGGAPPQAIGNQLNRSVGAVRLRMKKLGLPAGRVKARTLPSERMQVLKDTVSAGQIGLRTKK